MMLDKDLNFRDIFRGNYSVLVGGSIDWIVFNLLFSLGKGRPQKKSLKPGHFGILDNILSNNGSWMRIQKTQ